MLTVNSRAIRANHNQGDARLPTLRIYPDARRGEFLEVWTVEWAGASSMTFRHQKDGGSGVPGAVTVEVSILTEGPVRGLDLEGAVLLDLPADAELQETAAGS